LDALARAFFCEHSPHVCDWQYYPVYYDRNRQLESEPGLKVIKAAEGFTTPGYSVTFGISNGSIYKISDSLKHDE
jgi:hypothetical protein